MFDAARSEICCIGYKLHQLLALLQVPLSHSLLVELCHQLLLSSNNCRHLCMMRRSNLGMFFIAKDTPRMHELPPTCVLLCLAHLDLA